MNKEERNIGSIIVFVLILLLIGVGGYFLATNINKKEDDVKKEEVIVTKKVKKEEDNDYIYFINEEVLSEHNDLKYKDIVINIDSQEATNLQNDLNNQMASIKNSLVKIKDVDIDTTDIILYDDVYETEMIDYDVIETSNYVSLTVNNYTYKLETEATNSKLSYYVFDTNSGKLLSNRDILNKEGKTDQDVRTKIREYVRNDEDVDIDATLNQEYYLSISRTGKVIINTVVKTSTLNYNVSIEM